MPDLNLDDQPVKYLSNEEMHALLDCRKGFLPLVERIVARHRADAWDEGKDAAYRYTTDTFGDPGRTPVNPYRPGADRLRTSKGTDHA